MSKANKAANAAATVIPSAGAHITLSPVQHDAPVGKYGASAAHVPVANQLFRIAKGDAELFAKTGRNKAGRYTVQALVCRAAAKIGATTDKAVSGLAIVTAMQSDSELLEALGTCRATKYAPRTKVPCALWASDYVTGNASARVGLLVRSAS